MSAKVLHFVAHRKARATSSPGAGQLLFGPDEWFAARMHAALWAGIWERHAPKTTADGGSPESEPPPQERLR